MPTQRCCCAHKPKAVGTRSHGGELRRLGGPQAPRTTRAPPQTPPDRRTRTPRTTRTAADLTQPPRHFPPGAKGERSTGDTHRVPSDSHDEDHTREKDQQDSHLSEHLGWEHTSQTQACLGPSARARRSLSVSQPAAPPAPAAPAAGATLSTPIGDRKIISRKRISKVPSGRWSASSRGRSGAGCHRTSGFDGVCVRSTVSVAYLAPGVWSLPAPLATAGDVFAVRGRRSDRLPTQT